MMKKTLAVILVLIMIFSVNVFALSNSVVTGSNDTVFAGIGAGMESTLTKSGNILTVDIDLVGPMNLITGVSSGFKFDTTKLTYNSMVVGEGFANATAGWAENLKETNAASGYITSIHSTSSTSASINVAEGTRMDYVTMQFTIADGEDINSSNFNDAIWYANEVKAKAKFTFNLNGLNALITTYPNLFSFDASGLDSYNLSVNTPANGVAELGSTTVAGGQSTTLTVIPAVGYYIDSVMAGATNIASSFDAYRGGSINYTPTANTDITVTFAAIENVTEDVTTATGMTGVDAHTLPEVFRGKADAEATEDVSVAFGQIAPNAGKTIKGYGIYLTNSDGSDVTTAAPSIGPKFAAKTISDDNQFGIIFEQIKAGSYFAQTYIEYTDGSIVFGIKVPFTVE